MCVVLIIEDDVETSEAIEAALDSEGHECLVAYDGEDGLRQLVEERPQVVLLDLELPGIQGRDLLVEKAKLTAVASIPVIVVTAVTNPPILDGTLGTLRKPFSLDDLLERVAAAARPPEAAAG
jgi:DNA-binding response OmpR family regulator